MTTQDSAPVTFLYTDLVNSTELLSRLGDERARRVFQAHHKLLRDATEANSGQEVKWQGDGVMVAFASAAAAVRCAISMQQAVRRPIDGERLEIRIGMNVGEALAWDEEDYFGSPVVVAARLCHEAEGGQILCSSVVTVLLSGRQAFQFRAIGELELKGIPESVSACEVVYEEAEPGALLRHTPFVGRTAEATKLNEALQQARAGHGGLVMLVGEPGIGKTRLAEEFAEQARNEGATVLWGRCYEGEWTPPYGPFAEAIQQYAGRADAGQLAEDLGNGAGAIARIAPALRERLPDMAEPPTLEPDEERFRLLDAVSQFLIATSRRAPVVLVLDDLHWGDKGTIAMLRHVARFAPSSRTLVLGAYRDVELDRQHPLADALEALRREANFERLLIKGLDTSDVGRLITTVSERDVPEQLIQAISAETDGNPFFIREVLLDLFDRGAIYQEDGRWTSAASSVEELGIPEGVRQVIGRRLSRLSKDANQLLTAASAFNGGFRFGIAASVAGLDDARALDAIDAALEAQLVRPGGEADSFDFVHANIRQTLYTELSPPRQVRLHRQVAEAMEQAYGGRAEERAAELAYQYHRSSTLPGAERGVDYALAAVDRAEAAYARDEAASFLRMALEMLTEGDERHTRLVARLGLALAWTLNFDEALAAASEAGDLIAAAEGADAAADYLAEGARTLYHAGFVRGAWALAEQGLRHIGDRRDEAWVWLTAFNLVGQDAQDPENPGIPLDSPEREELARVAEEVLRLENYLLPVQRAFSSRGDVLARVGDDSSRLLFLAGDIRRSLSLWHKMAVEAEQQGGIANAVGSWAMVARCQNALGDFAAAGEAYRHSEALSARLAGPSHQALQIGAARFEIGIAQFVEISEEFIALVEGLVSQPAAEDNWALAQIRAVAANVFARVERADDAVQQVAALIPALERALGWSLNYPAMASDAASALWELQRSDHIEVIERNIREKVVGPDFRYPMRDGRLSLARLAALQGRHDEASEWFAKARTILDEQGARPLRAIADFDEALMYQRRSQPGDKELAAPLVEAALTQFRELGMMGWIRRAEELQQA